MTDVGFEEMDVDKRRNKIIELLTQKGKVKVVELSRMFGISEVTIRIDLSDLEKAGLLERVHGGAVGTYKAYYNMSLYDRMRTNEGEKRRIAVSCASMIEDGDTVMINSGTTTLFTVQEIRNIKNLTIVTNSVSIAQEAANCGNINTILLGGSFNTQYQFTYGDDALCQLKKYKADKLILSVDGVSASHGISTYHYLESELNRHMISRVNRTIVVADYTKIGRESFSHIESIENVELVITNDKAHEDEIRLLREHGVEVRLV